MTRHDVFFAHHEQFFAVDLDGLAGVLAEQDAVADFDVERTNLAVFETLAFADGYDFALIGLFGCGVRESRCRTAVLRSSSRRLTITRSCKGRSFIRYFSSLLKLENGPTSFVSTQNERVLII